MICASNFLKSSLALTTFSSTKPNSVAKKLTISANALNTGTAASDINLITGCSILPNASVTAVNAAVPSLVLFNAPITAVNTAAKPANIATIGFAANNFNTPSKPLSA